MKTLNLPDTISHLAIRWLDHRTHVTLKTHLTAMEPQAIKRIEATPDYTSIIARHPLFAEIVRSVAELYAEIGGPNYVDLKIAGPLGAYLVTITPLKPGVKTKHEINAELEGQIADLENDIADIRAELDEIATAAAWREADSLRKQLEKEREIWFSIAHRAARRARQKERDHCAAIAQDLDCEEPPDGYLISDPELDPYMPGWEKAQCYHGDRIAAVILGQEDVRSEP